MKVLKITKINPYDHDNYEFTIEVNGLTHHIRSSINYDNLIEFIDSGCPYATTVSSPSQSDWRITTNIAELKYLCKLLHYQYLNMAQEVSDYVDDHFEERILNIEFLMMLDELARSQIF